MLHANGKPITLRTNYGFLNANINLGATNFGLEHMDHGPHNKQKRKATPQSMFFI